MSDIMLKVLLAEGDRVDQMAFARLVREVALPYDYQIASSYTELYQLLQTTSFDVVILNHEFCHGATLEILSLRPGLSAIVTSGIRNERLAEQAEQAGASAYFTKDLQGAYLKALPSAIERAIKRRIT